VSETEKEIVRTTTRIEARSKDEGRSNVKLFVVLQFSNLAAGKLFRHNKKLLH
jgi:hypothetical protein